MDYFAAFIALIDNYAPWFVLAILVLSIYATIKSSLIGGTTAAFFGLGIVFLFLGIWLMFAGYELDAALLIIVAVVIMLIDAWHEKRVVRRGYARMQG